MNWPVNWGLVCGLALGATSITLGIAWKLGRWPPRRQRAQWYFEWYTNKALAGPYRSYNYAAIPWGIAWLAATFAAVVGSRHGPDAIVLSGLLVALLMGIAGLVFVYTHPRFLAPQWLRDVEAGRATLAEAGPPGVPAKVFLVLWAGFTVCVGAAAHFGRWDIVGPLLGGGGVLAATRIRRGRNERGSGWPISRRGGR